MTPNEFTAWLDGFLDGKDSLSADQIATLRAKAETLTPLRGLFPPMGPVVFTPKHPQDPPHWVPPEPVMCGGSLHVPHDPSIRVTN